MENMEPSSATPKTTNAQSTTKDTWSTLVQWVTNAGGQVHPSLTLRDDDNDCPRGVYTIHDIREGEVLIQLPSSCVISGDEGNKAASQGTKSDQGKDIQSSNDMNCKQETTKTVLPNQSPWLKCLIAYYKAIILVSNGDNVSNRINISRNNDMINSSEENWWKPYKDSLPTHYDTLLQWTDQEIQDYLAGTTLCDMIQVDRKEKSMWNRYQQAIRPQLQAMGLLQTLDATDSTASNNGTTPSHDSDGISHEEFQIFLQACMCISTRGFHLNTQEGDGKHSGIDNADNQNKKSRTEFGGPFLLPVIDLLNHDPHNSCTTLQRQRGQEGNSMQFWMVAERDIQAGEEVVHSYGNSLTAAQILQTFGFVPLPRQPLSSPSTAIMRKQLEVQKCYTPAVLSKTRHLLPICQRMKQRLASTCSSFSSPQPSSAQPDDNYAQELQLLMKSHDEWEEDETWDIHSIPVRELSDEISEDMIVSIPAVTTDATEKAKTRHNTTTINTHQSSSFSSPLSILSEELLTFVCVQFLPENVYNEIFPTTNEEDRSIGFSLLDSSVLEDFFLGKLVCHALKMAIQLKMDEYKTISMESFGFGVKGEDDSTRTAMSTGSCNSCVSILERDQKLLQNLLEWRRNQDVVNMSSGTTTVLPDSTDPATTLKGIHAIYGLMVRIEEMTSLVALRNEIEKVGTCLDSGLALEELKSKKRSLHDDNNDVEELDGGGNDDENDETTHNTSVDDGKKRARTS